MKPGGGKSKGSSWERECAKKLSLWLTNGEKSDVLWRSAMSGGRHTVGLKTGIGYSSQAGDLSSIDERGHRFISKYTVECKFYKDLYINSLVYGINKGISCFWEQAIRDARSVNKLPILIAKQNRYPALIGLTEPSAYLLFGGNPNNKILVYCPSKDLQLFYFDDFLKEAAFT